MLLHLKWMACECVEFVFFPVRKRKQANVHSYSHKTPTDLRSRLSIDVIVFIQFEWKFGTTQTSISTTLYGVLPSFHESLYTPNAKYGGPLGRPGTSSVEARLVSPWMFCFDYASFRLCVNKSTAILSRMPFSDGLR